jgi:hypothetical protein
MEIIPQGNVITIAIHSPWALALGALQAVLQARRIGIDAAVDMEFFTRFSAMLTFPTGAQSRVGFHTFFGDGPYRGDLITHRLLYNSHLRTSQMFEAMVEALTRDPALLPTFDFTPPAEQSFPAFRVRPNEPAEIEELLQQENRRLGSAPLILLNPNASDLLPLRRWPPLRYVELARRLLECFPDLFIAFTGTPAEAGPINGLATMSVPGACSRNHARAIARALRAQRDFGDERQRSRAFCIDDAHSRRDLVRTGNARPLRRPVAQRKCALRWDRVQPLRQCLQQPAVGLSRQSLHAGHHG